MKSNLEFLQQNDADVYAALKGEENRQKTGIELIPSENYTFPEVLAALGSVFTNKYSEGYPGRRYYGGQEFTDVIETLARDRARSFSLRTCQCPGAIRFCYESGGLSWSVGAG